jgi:UDP-N-acetylglucosamine acyltransferase
MIHPTAIVDPSARLAPSVQVGPYCIVGPEVEIGEDCELMAHLYVQGPIEIGARNKFFPYSTIGVVPQDLKFQGERSETVIGDDNTFREFVTLHRGTKGGGALTSVGNGCLVMAYTHVAHDCLIGNKVILGNGVTLAGHVVIQDFANVGAFSGIHQFCRVGAHALIGGYSVITQDVLPFSRTVAEREVKAYGLNKVGLERRGYTPQQMDALHHAFRLLLSSKLNTSQAVQQIRAEGTLSPEVQQLIAFIESSQRGVIK